MISVVLCTHNPRVEQLRRTLDGLKGQTLDRERWELVVVDNASRDRVVEAYDLSWHPRARHVRENQVGLTPARLRGIAESHGELIVFVDDDNVLAADYLEQALALHARFPQLGVLGAGRIEPEYEVEPPKELRPYLGLLAIRSVSRARWSNHPPDHESLPRGAGLCAHRWVADVYARLVPKAGVEGVLDRRGTELFCGGDDLFSWAAASGTWGFGIFPELRLTHLISAARLTRGYMLRLIHAQACSRGVLQYVLESKRPRHLTAFTCVHVALHGMRNGSFSMRGQWAEARGEDWAARFIAERGVEPLERDWMLSHREPDHAAVGSTT